MDPTALIREFHDRRRAVLSILDVARPELNRSCAEAWPAIILHRQKLSDAMQSFQKFKHERIFDPIIAKGYDDKTVAATLKADCIMLGAQYDAFRQKWLKTDVAANWPEYRLSAISMMTTIRKSLAEQDAIIRTLRLQ